MTTAKVETTPRDIARSLAAEIERLAAELMPGGHREGPAEWVVPSSASPFGCSISVHLVGDKAGIWGAWAVGRHGDALDLVAAALGKPMGEAIAWARRWLCVDDGEAEKPAPVVPAPREIEPPPDPDRWRRPWRAARPIAGTVAERYLGARGLRFEDPEGRVLRFSPRRARRGPEDSDRDPLQHHPAILAALSDARTGEQVGIINIFLQPDGADRLRDSKGKTTAGRAKSAVVMLSAFDEPTLGLTICEGAETGIALLMAGLAPVWACGAAGFVGTFPVLGGLECLTVAADADTAGQKAAATVAQRWREAGREVAIIAPPTGDWADGRKGRAA